MFKLNTLHFSHAKDFAVPFWYFTILVWNEAEL